MKKKKTNFLNNMGDYIATYCPVCKDTTQAIVLDETAPPAVIGSMVFNFIRSTRCEVCNQQAHRYEFECDSND